MSPSHCRKSELKVVASVVQAALEAALAAQLRGGALSVPLQEAFTNAFQRTLVPAFEAACQSMFAQAGLLPSKGFQAAHLRYLC